MNRLWGISGSLLAVFLLHACASGSYIVTGEVREPTNMELVKLYVEPPDEYKIIGIVKLQATLAGPSREAKTTQLRN